MTFELHSHTITFEAALRDLRSARDQTRAMAAHALADVVEPGARAEAVSALIEALADEHPEVRSGAAQALGHLETESAVAPLIEAVADDVPLVRQSAVVALGRLGFASSFTAIAEALRNGPPDVRFQAARSLAEIDPERAGEHLLAALDDGDGEVVGIVALTLGHIGECAAIEPLVALLDTWRKPLTRLDIAYALTELGDERAIPVLADYVANPAMSWDAIASLQRTGHPDALPPLVALLKKRRVHPSQQLPAAAAVVHLCGQFDSSESAGEPELLARRILLTGLRNRKLDMRGIAVALLGEVGGPWALAELRALAGKRPGRKLQEEIQRAIEGITSRERDGRDEA